MNMFLVFVPTSTSQIVLAISFKSIYYEILKILS